MNHSHEFPVCERKAWICTCRDAKLNHYQLQLSVAEQEPLCWFKSHGLIFLRFLCTRQLANDWNTFVWGPFRKVTHLQCKCYENMARKKWDTSKLYHNRRHYHEISCSCNLYCSTLFRLVIRTLSTTSNFNNSKLIMVISKRKYLSALKSSC